MKYVILFVFSFLMVSCLWVEREHETLGEVAVGNEFIVQNDVFIYSRGGSLRLNDEGEWERSTLYFDDGEYRSAADIKLKDWIQGEGGFHDNYVGRLDGYDGLYFFAQNLAYPVVCILNKGDTISVTDIKTIRGFSPMTLWGWSSWIYAKSPKCEYTFNAAGLFSIGKDEISPQSYHLRRAE